MTIKRNLNAETTIEGLTIDGKCITEYSEREVDNLRRRVANHLRTKAISPDRLVFVVNAIAMAYGDYESDYNIMSPTL